MNPVTMESLAARVRQLEAGGAASVVAIVDAVLEAAEGMSVSDIHFLPQSQHLEVLFRIDGYLNRAALLNKTLTANVIARLKVMAGLLTYRTDIPQEGSIRATPNGSEKRVSTFPTIHGETGVVRSFHASGRLQDLQTLGLAEPIRVQLEREIRQRSGAILLTGPSGSGKTTTIYACLRSIQAQRVGKHIITIEDPVEQVLEGVSQSQVRPGTEFDFARGLRSLLRQDPDVIMVGEIRDPETANVAIQASLAGHLVFSTLHATTACGVVSRLLEMGIEPYLLTSGIRCIVNQRLLRRLCEACKAPGVSGWNAVGCPACHEVGYRGRFLLAELLIPDAKFREGVLARADTEQLQEIVRSGGGPGLSDAVESALREGFTTRTEVERILGPMGKSA
jgi:type II secretory ATPase GspE/PulE/Tfp pilus assembly ATPase PilB-like protein